MTPLLLAAGKILSTTAKLVWGLKEGATLAVEAVNTVKEAKEVAGVGAELYHWLLMGKKEEPSEAIVVGKEIELDERQSSSTANPALKAALKKVKEEPVDRVAYQSLNFYTNPNRLVERDTPALKRTTSSPTLRPTLR